jgi:hypothetical protein
MKKLHDIRQSSPVGPSPNNVRFGLGDLAQIGESLVLGYALGDPSIPIDTALGTIGLQLGGLEGKLEELLTSIQEILDFLKNLVPAIQGVFREDLINLSMGKGERCVSRDF